MTDHGRHGVGPGAFSKLPVLVVGGGSIGQRHLGNLVELGVRRVGVVETSETRRDQLRERGFATYPELSNGLEAIEPECVIVATPPASHIEIADRAVDAGADVLIEKPLSNRLDGVQSFIEKVRSGQHVVRVGYNLRYHPGLRRLKELVDSDQLGRIWWLRAEFGQYLPDWRPSTDYRRTYTAHRNQGGGILLDASHEVDYVMWILGAPTDMVSMVGRSSDLEVDVEDNATVLLRFDDGAQADIHMDFLQRAYSRNCKIVGSEGTALWDYHGPALRVYRASTGDWEELEYEFDVNAMYRDELQSFLKAVVQRKDSLQPLTQARDVLRVVLRSREQAT